MTHDVWSRWALFASSIVVQLVIMIGFFIRVDTRVGYHDEQIAQFRVQLERLSSDFRLLSERIDRLDTPLARRVDSIGHQIEKLSASVTVSDGKLDYLSRDQARLEQRIEVIVRALDSIYGQYVDHLKEMHIGQTPPKERPPIR